MGLMVGNTNNHNPSPYGLSDENILAFINAWHEDFGKWLTPREARAAVVSSQVPRFSLEERVPSLGRFPRVLTQATPQREKRIKTTEVA